MGPGNQASVYPCSGLLQTARQAGTRNCRLPRGSPVACHALRPGVLPEPNVRAGNANAGRMVCVRGRSDHTSLVRGDRIAVRQPSVVRACLSGETGAVASWIETGSTTGERVSNAAGRDDDVDQLLNRLVDRVAQGAGGAVHMGQRRPSLFHQHDGAVRRVSGSTRATALISVTSTVRGRRLVNPARVHGASAPSSAERLGMSRKPEEALRPGCEREMDFYGSRTCAILSDKRTCYQS